jgi:hypothetical protein
MADVRMVEVDTTGRSDGDIPSWDTAAGMHLYVTPSGVPVGTSMPGGPATNDLIFRTDLGLLFFYNGTRWLTVNLYTQAISTQDAVQPFSAASTIRCSMPHPTLDIWIVSFWASTYVATTNDGTKYWTLTLGGPSTALSTISNASDGIVVESASVGASLAATLWLEVAFAKVSTPGTIRATPMISYRLIGT